MQFGKGRIAEALSSHSMQADMTSLVKAILCEKKDSSDLAIGSKGLCINFAKTRDKLHCDIGWMSGRYLLIQELRAQKIPNTLKKGGYGC